VFTAENTTNTPEQEWIFSGPNFETLLEIDTDKIKHKLMKLWVDKAAGVDEMSTQLLKEIQDLIV